MAIPAEARALLYRDVPDAPAGGSSSGAVRQLAVRLTAVIKDELHLRRSIRELRQLEEHMLTDIGVTPADLAHLRRRLRF